jgi:hypothetical protein
MFQNVRQSVQHPLYQGETTMAQRHQRGWLKRQSAQGETWVLFFRTTRQSDGKRVENKIPIGLVRHLPDIRLFGGENHRFVSAGCLATDPKTVQTLLRHSDVKLTLQFDTHAVSRDRMVAAEKMLSAILSHAPDKNGLTAD